MLNKRNKLLVIILLTLISLNFISPNQVTSQTQKQVVDTPVATKKLDQRAEILRKYFAQYNSPLQYQAQDFVDAADKYGIDWKLVPAISGVESTFGKAIPGGYNAWGWGVYGDQALGFNSWRSGIFTVTGGLKENYINKGLTDPYSINKVYAASPTWGAHVSYFLKDLDKFARAEGYVNDQPIQTPITTDTKVSGSSAILAYK